MEDFNMKQIDFKSPGNDSKFKKRLPNIGISKEELDALKKRMNVKKVNVNKIKEEDSHGS